MFRESHLIPASNFLPWTILIPVGANGHPVRYSAKFTKRSKLQAGRKLCVNLHVPPRETECATARPVLQIPQLARSKQEWARLDNEPLFSLKLPQIHIRHNTKTRGRGIFIGLFHRKTL